MIVRTDKPALLPRVSILAFCETEPVMHAINAAFAHPSMARAQTSVLPARTVDVGGVGKTVMASGLPGAVIIEVSEQADQPEILRQLTKFAAYCDQDTVVLVIGHNNDIGLYRALINEGVADYLVTPVTSDQIVQVLSSRLTRKDATDKANKVIAVVSARGGAGTTTIASNLAWLLAQERAENTCLVDLDLPFGGLATALDCQPDPELSALLYTPELITDPETLHRMLIHKTSNLSVLCATPSLEAAGKRRNDAGTAHLIKLLRTEFSCTVLDVPLHWNAVIENLLVKANHVVLVTTPDFTGLPPAQTLLRYLGQLRDDTQVLFNQSRPRDKDTWKLDDARTALNVQQAFQIAADSAFPDSVAQGRVLCDLSPSHAAAQELRRLIDALFGTHENKASGWSLPFSRLFQRGTQKDS